MTLCSVPAAYLENVQDRPAYDLHIVPSASYGIWHEKQPENIQNWLKSINFSGKPGKSAICPTPLGDVSCAIFIEPESERLGTRDWSAVVAALPDGDYQLVSELSEMRLYWFSVGWALGQYRFTRYKSNEKPALKRLIWPEGVDREAVLRQVSATYLVRDLVNTPAEDMGPDALSQVAKQLADKFKASCKVTSGDDLASQYPSVYMVGRAAEKAPRMIDISWGAVDAPRVTIVGKGVCFDTGGLNMKPASGMKLMKKDMGGSAHALAIAYMIMEANLPIRLRVLIPAVENNVAGNAIRPQDVITTRSGKTVEVGNTDAEGRLILADALTAAGDDSPELIIDFATLTGAARSALGPDLPAMYTGCDKLAAQLSQTSLNCGDPMWRLPLWEPYTKLFASKVADIANASETPFAGSITAALFLSGFVPNPKQWIHLDLYAWNPAERPGQPEGGEAHTLQSLFAVIQSKYSV